MIDLLYFSNSVRSGGPHLGSMAIGELYDRLAEELVDNHMLQTAGSNFKLLGVYSRYTNKLVGVMPEVLPASVFQHLVFNFEIVGRKRTGYTTIFRNSNKALQSGKEKLDTLAIGLSSSDCAKLNLSVSLSDLLFYKRAGAVFTEQLRVWRKQYNTTYTESIDALHDRYFRMPFGTLVKLPYKYWAFNKEVWRNPMLLSPKWITEEVALFYWTYVFDQVVIPYSSNIKVLAPVLNDFLQDSILRLRQTLNSKTGIGPSAKDRIAPTVLHVLMGPGIPTGIEELNEFVKGFDDAQLVQLDKIFKNLL